MSKGEVWEVIPGFNGKYFISNHGSVARKQRYKASDRFQETRKWQYQKKLVAIQYDDYGESWVKLTYPDGRRAERRIRRLVAEAFMGATRGDKIIHKDDDPYNCRLDNLRLSSMPWYATINEWQYQYCVEQHYEHGVPWKELGQRFLILPDNLRKLVWKRRRDGNHGQDKMEEGRRASGAGEAQDNRGTESDSGQDQECDQNAEQHP